MIVHKNFMASDRRGNPYTASLKNHQARKSATSEKDRTDLIEISEEAMKSYETARILDLDKSRLKKEAEQIIPLIKELMGRDGDLRNIIRLQKIIDMRQKIIHHEPPWEDDTVITEISDRLIH